MENQDHPAKLPPNRAAELKPDAKTTAKPKEKLADQELDDTAEGEGLPGLNIMGGGYA